MIFQVRLAGIFNLLYTYRATALESSTSSQPSKIFGPENKHE